MQCFNELSVLQLVPNVQTRCKGSPANAWRSTADITGRLGGPQPSVSVFTLRFKSFSFSLFLLRCAILKDFHLFMYEGGVVVVGLGGGGG